MEAKVSVLSQRAARAAEQVGRVNDVIHRSRLAPARFAALFAALPSRIKAVAGAGIEPATRGFSVRCSTS